VVRKHAHTQERLCARFARPVIETVTCQDVKTAHMQKIVNAAPTPGEGVRLRQAGDRSLPAPKMTVAGESALLLDLRCGAVPVRMVELERCHDCCRRGEKMGLVIQQYLLGGGQLVHLHGPVGLDD
jgi:hypothetical protein